MINKSRKTKIVATVGPACSDIDNLEALMHAGVNVFRLNFSHGNHKQHLAVIQNIHALNKKLQLNIGILADLQGPKLRIGVIENNGITLNENDTIKVSSEDVIGNKDIISVTYENLSNDIKVGESILIDDGKIELKVTKILNAKTIECTVVFGGILSSKKGFNLPDTKISIPSLTEKDMEDVAFILQHQIDWIALSFVRKASDITELKTYLNDRQSTAKIIAKIEKPLPLPKESAE